MSTETPLDRAAQAVRDTYDDPAGVSGLPPMPLDRAAATAAVTAALDVEEMARVLYDFDWDAPGDQPWQTANQLLRDIYLDRARALRTSILGGAR